MTGIALFVLWSSQGYTWSLNGYIGADKEIKNMKNNNHNKINENDPYQPDNIPLYEAIYGKNLISLGSLAAIDNMIIIQ